MDRNPIFVLNTGNGNAPSNSGTTMKLRIRWKFFFVLLAFSLIPLFVFRGVMSRVSLRVLDSVSSRTHAELLDIMTGEMERMTVTYATLVEERAMSVGLVARILAQQAEKALALPDANAEQPVFARDFDMGRNLPEDTAPRSPYYRQTMMGKTRPLPVSMTHPAFFLPGASRTQDGEDRKIRELVQIGPVMADLYQGLEGAAYWLHVSLNNGLHMVYPGHGGIPMMFDPRDQEWFRRVRKSKTLTWTMPLVDPTLRSGVGTVSYPILDRDGNFLGAAGVDIPISAALMDMSQHSEWERNLDHLMVLQSENPATEAPGLSILAQQEYESGSHHWRMEFSPEWLGFDQPGELRQLITAMGERSQGHMALSYKGKPSICAFATADHNVAFLVIAPETTVNALPDEIVTAMDTLFIEMRNLSAAVVGSMLAFAALLAWFGTRRVTSTLLSLVDMAQKLSAGDFDARLDTRTGDERDILISALNRMGPKLRDQVRLRRNMELAEEVQRLLLPSAEPVAEGYDIAGGISYCDRTGGDYYDFIPLETGDGSSALGVVLGDVAGHDTASALLMATARGQLHTLAGLDMNPAERMGTINDSLARDLDGTGRFLTLFYLRLKSGSPRIRWVRAGHDPAFVYMPDSDSFDELGGDGLPLGVLAGTQYEERERDLPEGALVVMATDGVWEARNNSGHMFGKERTLAIIRENAHKHAEGVKSAIMNAVAAFADGRQDDDIAVVVIKKI